MTDTLDYTVAALKRAAEMRYTWPVSPAEAEELVAEIERLRERLEVRIQHCHNLRTMLESATDTERAAVVAWLRREIQKCGCDDDTAACIERGEHRRSEGESE